MSRHRDIRCMKYSDEYDGYDDVYGHSVEDDYCISPGAEQFIYDRNKSSFLSVNEDGEASTIKKPELPELETAKLMSCIETIRNIIGKETISDNDLVKKIIDSNFNSEAVLDEILNDSGNDELSKTSSEQSATSTGTLFKTPTQGLNVPRTPAKPVPGRTDWHDRLSPRIGSPRSQSPSAERNSPSIRRREEKKLASKSNTPRCQSPNPDFDARSAKSAEESLALYKLKREKEKEQIHLVVVGHVDAGKSTLLGRLLCDLGQVSSKLIHKYQQESKKIGKQSFMYAWVLDETGEERERGITMDVGYSKFETETKNVTLLDAPGHKDFIPNMIMGATQADVALLVVDATRGEFETGFDSGGQTREHALLLRSLGVSQLAVIVNKLDTVNWSKDRFNEIVEKLSVFLKQVGFRQTITFVPCSGLSGENIASKPKAEGLANWYNGPTLVDVIDNFKCPERSVDKPFRFSVNDIFKGMGSGFCVSGRVETGMVSAGDKVLVLPRNEVAVARTLQIDEVSIPNAFAGDQVVLNLSNYDQQNISIGDILCNPQNPVPVTSRFEAHIVIFNTKMPITRGLPVVLHQQCLVEAAVIRKLISHLHKSTGEVIKKKPKCLPKNSSAIVEIETQRPICVELYRDVKQLGRVMLRVEGATIAAGLITKIK